MVHRHPGRRRRRLGEGRHLPARDLPDPRRPRGGQQPRRRSSSASSPSTTSRWSRTCSTAGCCTTPWVRPRWLDVPGRSGAPGPAARRAPPSPTCTKERYRHEACVLRQRCSLRDRRVHDHPTGPSGIPVAAARSGASKSADVELGESDGSACRTGSLRWGFRTRRHAGELHGRDQGERRTTDRPRRPRRRVPAQRVDRRPAGAAVGQPAGRWSSARCSRRARCHGGQRPDVAASAPPASSTSRSSPRRSGRARW